MRDLKVYLNKEGHTCPFCNSTDKNSNICKASSDLTFALCHKTGGGFNVGDIMEVQIRPGEPEATFAYVGESDDGWGQWKREDSDQPRKKERKAQTRTWQYFRMVDHTCTPEVRVTRIDTPGESKRIFQEVIQDDFNQGSTVADLAPKLAPLYWDEVRKRAADGELVFLVEGEATADAVRGIGLNATTLHVNGDPQILSGCGLEASQFVVCPDQDVVGIKKAKEVSEAIPGCRFLHVRPGTPEWNGSMPRGDGLDAFDWIANGAQPQDFLKNITSELDTRGLGGHGMARTLSGDIAKLLNLEMEERADEAWALRNEIKKFHKANDAKISRELLQAIQNRYSPVRAGSKVARRRSTRRSTSKRTQYLHDGLTPAASICQTDGPSDAGKSSFEAEKCIAVVEGRGCFDRDYPAKQGSVLYIATDSGTNDFYATLDNLGYSDHPAIAQGESEPGDVGYIEGAPAFFIWAESPEDGIKAWTATPPNIAHLIEFVRDNNVRYIVMDSVKTIMGEGVSYTDNTVVAQFLIMLKSTVCLTTGATICLINHDGVIQGEAAGAKAWKENVTMRTRLESVHSPDGKRIGSKALVCKDRVGGSNRSFGYKFSSTAAFELMDGAEPVSRCDEQIAEILWHAYLQGKKHLLKCSILEETRKLGIADSTVSNTLSQVHFGDLIQKRSRGVYELTKNQLEAFDRRYL